MEQLTSKKAIGHALWLFLMRQVPKARGRRAYTPLLYICAMTPFNPKNNDDDFNDDETNKG